MAKRKLNIADILIFIVVIGVILLAVYKFAVVNKSEDSVVQVQVEKTLYTAFVDEVRMATVNALHVGDLIYDEKSGVCIGEIKDISSKQVTKNVINKDNETITVPYPDYYSVTLTIEGAIVEREDGYFVDGVVELKANSELNIYTKYAMPVIKVTSIGN